MPESRNKGILYGNIPKQILLLSVPYIGAYLLQQVYQFADSIVLGKFAGTAAMAAIGGSTIMIVNIVLNFICGMCSGTMVLIAQYYGSYDPENVHKSIKTGMFIAIVFGGLLSILGLIFSKPLLIAMKVPSDILNYSLIYIYMYFISMIPYAIYTTGMYALRAAGNSRSSILFTVIIAIVKISLDLLLTVWLKLGIWGVSISTFVSFLVCAIVVIFILEHSKDLYRYSIKDFGFDKELLLKIIKLGIPLGVQTSIFSITNAYISVKINVHGTNAIAAFSAYNNVDNIFWSFSNSIGVVLLTMSGQNYGNNNMKRVKEALIYGSIIYAIISIVIGGFIYFTCSSILTIFTTDLEVIDIATQMNKLVALSYITYTLTECISSTIKGCGDTMNSMIISIIGICGSRFLYLFTVEIIKPVQVLYCYPISWIITSIMFLIYYLYKEKQKRVNTNNI